MRGRPGRRAVVVYMSLPLREQPPCNISLMPSTAGEEGSKARHLGPDIWAGVSLAATAVGPVPAQSPAQPSPGAHPVDTEKPEPVQ